MAFLLPFFLELSSPPEKGYHFSGILKCLSSFSSKLSTLQLHLLPVSVEGHAVIGFWCIESMRSLLDDQMTFTDHTATTALSCCFIQHKVFSVFLQSCPFWRIVEAFVISWLAGRYSLLTDCMFVQYLTWIQNAELYPNSCTLKLLYSWKVCTFECIEKDKSIQCHKIVSWYHILFLH